MSLKQQLESKEMYFSVLVNYEEGYSLHDLEDR